MTYTALNCRLSLTPQLALWAGHLAAATAAEGKAADFFDVDHPARCDVGEAGIDALAHIDLVHHIIPGRIRGRGIDQTMGVGFDVSRGKLWHHCTLSASKK